VNDENSANAQFSASILPSGPHAVLIEGQNLTRIVQNHSEVLFALH